MNTNPRRSLRAFPRWTIAIASAGLGLVFPVSPAAGQIDSLWVNPAGGLWTAGANWSTNPIYPNNDGVNTYRAVIDLGGPAYSVNLASSVTISALGLGSTAATVQHTAGVLEVTGLADLASGVYRLDGGTLRGGVWTPEPGTLVIANNAANRLEHVSLMSDLYVGGANAQVAIADGITLGGTLTLAGSNALIVFTNTQTVSGGRIMFSALAGEPRAQVGLGQVLTLSPSTEFAGGWGLIYGEGAVQNLGTIRANVSGRQMSVATNGISNSGLLICENNSTLAVGSSTSTWTNEPTGTIRLASGTIRLDGAWTNQGLIELAGGTLSLDGTYATPAIGTIARTGGVIQLAGVIDNSGSSLDVNASTDSIHLYGATIVGGEINAADGKSLIIDSGRSTFDGVVVNAPIVFNASNSSVLLLNGAVIAGPVTLTTPGVAIYLGAGMTVDNNTYWLNATSNSSSPRIALEGAGLVTFGPNFIVRGGYGSVTGDAVAALLNLGRVFVDSRDLTVNVRSFENDGLLEATGTGRLYVGGSASTWSNALAGTLHVDSAATLETSGTWQNHGTIDVDGGNLNLGGTFSLEPDGAIQRNGGTVTLVGTLQNADRTLTLDAASGPWIFSNNGSGTGLGIVGGALHVTNPQYAYFGNNLAGTFDGVTVNGPVTIQSPSPNTTAQLKLRNGTRFIDGVYVPNRGLLNVVTPQTLDNSTIHLTGGELRIVGTELVTFGPGMLVHGTNLFQHYGNQGGGFVNQGTIVADQSGGTLRVDHENFRNEGVLRAINGGILRVATAGDSNSVFVNTPGGRIEATGSTVLIGSNTDAGQIWRNEGEIVIDNSILDMYGTHTPAEIGQVTRTGGEVWFSGVMNNQENVWDFASGTGPWRLMNHGTVQGGVVNISEATLDPRSDGVFSGALLIGDILIDGGSLDFRFGSQIRGRIRLRDAASLSLDASNWTETTELLFEGEASVSRGGWSEYFIIPSSMQVHGSCGIDGPGFVLWANERITNEGTVTADLGSIRFTTYAAEGYEFYNVGTVRAQNGKRVQFGFFARFPNITANGALSGGRWEVFGNSRIEITAFPHINEAEVLLSGANAYFAPVAAIDDNRGELALANNKQVYLEPTFLNEGVLRVGRGCLLGVSEQFTQTNAALLEIMLAASGAAGRILSDGTVQLAGSLAVVLASGFTPQLGDEFEVVFAQLGLQGAFDSIDLPALGEGLEWAVVRSSNAVTLRVDAAPAPCTGDLNGDRTVDLSDLAILLAHFGTVSGATDADGDIDGDEAVTLGDLALLLSNFGSVCR